MCLWDCSDPCAHSGITASPVMPQASIVSLSFPVEPFSSAYANTADTRDEDDKAFSEVRREDYCPQAKEENEQHCYQSGYGRFSGCTRPFRRCSRVLHCETSPD